MNMSARALRPALTGATIREPAEPRPNKPAGKLAFRLALLAVVLQFLISSNFMQMIGVNYNTPGGNPLLKFHPSTYLSILAALTAMRDRGGIRLCIARLLRDSPSHILFVGGMLLCAVFALVSVGTTGAAVFVDNYVSTGMLLYVLEASGMRRRERLGWVMLALCLANVVIAVCETSVQAHLIPPYVGETLSVDNPNDFRGTGLFDHPLTGAAVVMLTLLSLPGMRLPTVITAPSFMLLCMGLIAFGGRTALAVSAITLIVVAICAVVRGLYLRKLQATLCAAIVLASLIIPPAAYVVMTETPIGARLAAHFYLDDSAETRSLQWRALNLLTLREALFGIQEERIPVLVYTLDLDAPFSGIENPWLNTYLKLGAVGCVIYLAALIPLLVHLWRFSALWGRILLVAGFVVISSSNTLGHKSNTLFLLVAYIAASRGYAAETMPRRAAREMPPRSVIPPLLAPRRPAPSFNQVST